MLIKMIFCSALAQLFAVPLKRPRKLCGEAMIEARKQCGSCRFLALRRVDVFNTANVLILEVPNFLGQVVCRRNPPNALSTQEADVEHMKLQASPSLRSVINLQGVGLWDLLAPRFRSCV